MSRFRSVAVVSAAVLVAGLGAFVVDAQGASDPSPRTITVAGAGIVTSVPNEADFTFGVSTTAKTAVAALSANGREMNKVIAALRAHGIAKADLQTAQISLSPNTNQNGSTIINYTAANSVTAHSKNIRTTGAIVDAAVGAGANLVGGPSLTRSDQKVLSRRALTAAIADARARAQTIAAAAKVKLGRVRSVSEVGNTPITNGAAAFKESSSTPVEPGTVQIEADVIVTFDIV